MKAPEKLYLSKNIYNTSVYQVPDSDDKTQVEYIRMDAFIEKACKWLDDNLHHYWGSISADPHNFLFDFRKVMEE